MPAVRGSGPRPRSAPTASSCTPVRTPPRTPPAPRTRRSQTAWRPRGGARAAGLGVNAGHDLDQANLAAFVAAVPHLLEVSIGHALVGEALHAGLPATVRAYLALLAAAPEDSDAG
jgi:hypothetical protein